jgi:hypothetical protein
MRRSQVKARRRVSRGGNARIHDDTAAWLIQPDHLGNQIVGESNNVCVQAGPSNEKRSIVNNWLQRGCRRPFLLMGDTPSVKLLPTPYRRPHGPLSGRIRNDHTQTGPDLQPYSTGTESAERPPDGCGTSLGPPNG